MLKILKQRNEQKKLQRESIPKARVDYVFGFEETISIICHLHYTFPWPRIRIGGGCSIAFGFIDKFTISYDDNKRIPLGMSRKKNIHEDGAFTSSPHLIIRPFLGLGFILNSNLVHHFVFDIRPGISFYISQAKNSEGYIQALYGDAGISYEKRMGSFLRAFIRLSSSIEYTPEKQILFSQSIYYFDPKNDNTTDGQLQTTMFPAFSLQVGLGTYLYKHRLAHKELRRISAKRIARRKAEAEARRAKRLAALKAKAEARKAKRLAAIKKVREQARKNATIKPKPKAKNNQPKPEKNQPNTENKESKPENNQPNSKDNQPNNEDNQPQPENKESNSEK